MFLYMQPQSNLNMHRNYIWRMYFCTSNIKWEIWYGKGIEKEMKIEKKEMIASKNHNLLPFKVLNH